MSVQERPIKRVKADWDEVVLVCRKCSRKLDGGFGPDGDERFVKAMQRELRRETGRKTKGRKAPLGLIEVDCLDICPKGAVVVVRGSDPHSWLVVPKGADMTEIARRLGVSPAEG